MVEGTQGFAFRPGASGCSSRLPTSGRPGCNVDAAGHRCPDRVGGHPVCPNAAKPVLLFHAHHAGHRRQRYDITSSFTQILQAITNQLAQTYVVRYRATNRVLAGARTVRVEFLCNTTPVTATGTYTPGATPVIQREAATIALAATPWADGTAFTIGATVTDAVAPAVTQVRIYYRTTGTSAYASMVMPLVSGTAQQGTYRITLPGAAAQTPGFDYYLTATDGQSTAADPMTDPSQDPYQIAILPNVAPAITHTPVTAGVTNQAISIGADVVDGTNRLDYARLYYRQTGTLLYTQAPMTLGAGHHFTATIPASFATTDGDRILHAGRRRPGRPFYPWTRDLPHSIAIAAEVPSAGIFSIEPTLDWVDVPGAALTRYKWRQTWLLPRRYRDVRHTEPLSIGYDQVPLANATRYYWRVVTSLQGGGTTTSGVSAFTTVAAARPILPYPTAGAEHHTGGRRLHLVCDRERPLYLPAPDRHAAGRLGRTLPQPERLAASPFRADLEGGRALHLAVASLTCA